MFSLTMTQLGWNAHARTHTCTQMYALSHVQIMTWTKNSMLQNILWTYQHITVWHRKAPIIIPENLKFSVSNCSVQFMWWCTKFIKKTANKLHMWTQINTLVNSILVCSWRKMCRVGYRERKCDKFGFENGVRSEFYRSQTYNRMQKFWMSRTNTSKKSLHQHFSAGLHHY